MKYVKGMPKGAGHSFALRIAGSNPKQYAQRLRDLAKTLTEWADYLAGER
jgi:hypothetical protein